jgi:hypothetical protein
MTPSTANSKSFIASEKPPSWDCKISNLLQPLKPQPRMGFLTGSSRRDFSTTEPTVAVGIANTEEPKCKLLRRGRGKKAARGGPGRRCHAWLAAKK